MSVRRYSSLARCSISSDPVARAVAISPAFTTDQTVYAGYDRGGVFKSTDGIHWSPATPGLPAASVVALGISPAFASDNTLFAGSIDLGGLSTRPPGQL